jgi:hypothetical protein
MIRLYNIETNSDYLKSALINTPVTQEFSEVLSARYPIPYINEPIKFLVGIGEVVNLSLLRCERVHLPLVRNGFLSNFIDKISKKRIGSKQGINIFKEDLITQSHRHITSTDLIVDFKNVGQHQVTIYGISAESHIALSSSQSKFIAIMFANIGSIFEPIYIQIPNEKTLLGKNFFPEKFISNLKTTNLFNEHQLKFITNNLKTIIGSETVNHMPIHRALERELNHLVK